MIRIALPLLVSLLILPAQVLAAPAEPAPAVSGQSGAPVASPSPAPSDLKAQPGADAKTQSPAEPAKPASPDQPNAKTGEPARAATGEKKKGVRRGNAPCLTWIDHDVPVRAAILCVHGLGLHNGTYEDFGKRLAKLGFAIYAIDVRGFGSWMEAKGRERVDFEGCMADMKSTLQVIHRAHPGLPVYVLGESMGGAIALRTAAKYPELVDGLISSVPAGDRFKQGKTTLKVALRFLDGPNKQFNVGEGVINQATQKQELRDAWCNDPLARLSLSPKELMQFQAFMNENHESAKVIKNMPVLIVQGCKDQLVRPEGTVELFNELATKDKQLQLILSAEHLVFEENQFTDDDIRLVSRWLDRHLEKRNSEAEKTTASN